MTEQQFLPPLEIQASQADAELFHVGTYRRIVPVSLARMYENALDWEHLPYVHASSFGSIDCLDSGPWGWRAALTSTSGGSEASSEIELRLDRTLRRWITRNHSGNAAGAQIWTHVFEKGPRQLQLNVDFFVPAVAPSQRAKVGRAYANLYTTLYDEDVAMMVERQRQLDQRIETTARPVTLELGKLSLLPERSVHELGGRQWLVIRQDSGVSVLPALCPHQLGPLQDGQIVDGSILCPWHGYRFELATGHCPNASQLSVDNRPLVSERNGQLILTLE